MAKIDKLELVRTRIAPTPSGNLHIGTAHTALFNYLYAKHSGGKFILRIDDSDPKRSKPEFEKDILNSLKWLGLDWDEGPDIGGNYGPYRQSERMNHYWPYIEKLLKEGKAYYCYCSLEELDVERKQQQASKQAPKYSGKCRNLSKDQIEAYIKEGRVPTVRLKVPEKEVSFIDPARGMITVNGANFGDFIIARSDKTALLIVATTIDDIEMKVTHAIRGEDYINFVPRQIVLFEALGVKPPVFAHLPFVYAPDGSKLSKRHGAVAISEYRDQGFLPEAVFNYLTLLGWSAPENQEILNQEETIKLFTLERVNTNPHRFNLTKLEWINGEYIRQMKNEKLKIKILEFIGEKYREDIVEKTVPLVRERMKKLSDYLLLSEFFFKKPQKWEVDLSNRKELIKKMHDVLTSLSDWRAELIGEKMQELAKKEGVKTGEFFMTLRVVITGKKISPPLNESMEILGKGETLERLKKLQ